MPLTRTTRGLHRPRRDRQAAARARSSSTSPAVGSSTRRPSPRRSRPATSAGAGIDVFEHEPPTDSPLLDGPEHAPDPAPRRVHRRGAGPRRRGGRGTGPRRPRRSQRPVRGERAAAHARDGPGDRARTCRWPRSSVGSSPSSRAAASGRSPSRSPASSPSTTASPLTAAVLRGLLETTTTERVNLVNAGALAKARGITVVERKTPDAGAFAALLTLSTESRSAGPRRGRDRRRRRAADHPPRRLSAGHGAVRRHAHHPPQRPTRHGRADRDPARRGRRQHQRDAPRPEPAARGCAHDPRPRRRRPGRASPRRSGPTSVRDLWTIRLGGER